MNGCECANALVICGGVATSKGDFLCTMMVERCFAVAEYPEVLLGAKAATVGGFGSKVCLGEAGPLLTLYVDDFDIGSSQGRSVDCQYRDGVGGQIGLPIAAMQRSEYRHTRRI